MNQNYFDNQQPNLSFIHKNNWDNIFNSLDYMINKLNGLSNKQTLNPIDNLTVDQIIYLQKYLEQVKENKINQLVNTNTFNNQNEVINQNEYNQNKFNGINGFDYQNTFNDQYIANRSNEGVSSLNKFVQSNLVNEQKKVPSINTRIGKKMASDLISNKMSVDLINKQIVSNPNNDPGNLINEIQNKNDYYNPYSYGPAQNQIHTLSKTAYLGSYLNDKTQLNAMGLTGSEISPNGIRNVGLESSLIQCETTHLPGQRQLSEKEIDRFQMLPYNPQDTKHIQWGDSMPRGGFATRTDRLESN